MRRQLGKHEELGDICDLIPRGFRVYFMQIFQHGNHADSVRKKICRVNRPLVFHKS